jgi:hypothetical protein
MPRVFDRRARSLSDATRVASRQRFRNAPRGRSIRPMVSAFLSDDVVEPEAPDASAPAPRPPSRISLVLDDEIVSGTLRLWKPYAVIHLDQPAPSPLPIRGLLQYISGDGVWHQRGELSYGAIELAHWITFRPLGDPQLLLMRERLSVALSVPVSISRPDGTTLDTETAELSEGELLLAETVPVQIGEQVSLSIQLDVFAPPISGVAEIDEITEEGRISARYVEFRKDALERLSWRIFRQVRSELRRTRAETESERRGRARRWLT